ncbi:hypothetical protein H0H93_010761 [Arthromyces matolae]|nr:hypothetical protein H0H93_010761 [Arthromyces matolae]
MAGRRSKIGHFKSRRLLHALGKRISGPVQEPIVDGFPFITEYGSEKTKFTYLSLLDSNHPNKLVYLAIDRDTKKKLIVKFASKYNSAAHRLLSEHSLAPTLHYPSKDDNGSVRYGGRQMIVMDYVEMKPLSGSLSIAQSKEVRRSIDLLHENNFVFGDLRPPNILIEGDKAMLVDFDWCGEDGKAHYPADLDAFMGIQM